MGDQVNPEVYVACLAAYNSGCLHGRWIDATQGADNVHEEIQAMLAESPCKDAEEWAVHDYEGFGGVRIDEYDSIEYVCDVAEFIEESGEVGADILGYYSELEEAKRAMDELYRGEWGSELGYATDLFDEALLHDVPENVRSYIDYEAFRRDLFCCDYFSIESSNGSVHVFSNC